MRSQAGRFAVAIGGTIVALALGARGAVAQEPDGAALYRQHCRPCHGLKGVPPQRMLTVYPELKAVADSGALSGLALDSIVAAMRHGKGKQMRSFADALSPEQIAAVAKYVKSL